MSEHKYDQNVIENGFRRQRGNLQLICFGLIFFYYVDIKLDSVSISGVKASTENPNRIVHLTWIAYLMFSVAILGILQ